MYDHVITQKCNSEKQTLKNFLSTATQAPDEFAFDLMKGPGYMAVVAGEVVHIVKCVPVEIKMEYEVPVLPNYKSRGITTQSSSHQGPTYLKLRVRKYHASGSYHHFTT